MISKRLFWITGFIVSYQFFGGSRISEHAEQTGWTSDSVAKQTANRKLYRYAVIPGGIYSAEELARARRTDEVVAAHYADFGSDARVARLGQDQLLYVSYRKADKVFWTKGKHKVCGGEAVVMDGKNMARSRCGNRLSRTPQKPTAPMEPKEAALGTPEPVTNPLAMAEPGPALAGPGMQPSSEQPVGATPGPMNPVQTGAGSEFPFPATVYGPVFPALGAGPLTRSSTQSSMPGGSPVTTGSGTTTLTPISTGTTPITAPTGTSPSATATPEPGHLTLFAGGLMFFGFIARRAHRRFF